MGSVPRAPEKKWRRIATDADIEPLTAPPCRRNQGWVGERTQKKNIRLPPSQGERKFHPEVDIGSFA